MLGRGRWGCGLGSLGVGREGKGGLEEHDDGQLAIVGMRVVSGDGRIAKCD